MSNLILFVKIHHKVEKLAKFRQYLAEIRYAVFTRMGPGFSLKKYRDFFVKLYLYIDFT